MFLSTTFADYKVSSAIKVTDLIARRSELLWVCHGTLSIRVRAGIPLHSTPQGTQAPDNARNIIPNALRLDLQRQEKNNTAGKRAGYLG